MTSNPAFTERNIQKVNVYLLDSRPEQKSLVTYLTLQSLYVCVWLVNTLTYTVPIGSPIICMWSPADIREQWERNLSFGSADVSAAGTRDEPLRTSAWETNPRPATQARPLGFNTTWSKFSLFSQVLWLVTWQKRLFRWRVVSEEIVVIGNGRPTFRPHFEDFCLMPPASVIYCITCTLCRKIHIVEKRRKLIDCSRSCIFQ